MFSLFIHDLQPLIASYGYVVVIAFVGLESAGLPLPGETVLIAAAIVAGTTGDLGIVPIILAAAAGAILGDNLGFWVGRVFGVRLLRRYGRYVGIDEARIRLGQYLFLRHGGKVVFFGRFVALLRAFAAVLAGTNRMPWGRFLVCNMAGGLLWATLYGMGGYLLGANAHRLLGPVGLVALALAAIALTASAVVLRRSRDRLQAEADRTLSGPAR